MGNSVEQLLARSRDQTWVVWCAHHGVTLARTRLSVCEDTRVVAAKVVVEELFAKGAVDVFLVGIVRVALVMRPVRTVKGELLVLENPSPVALLRRIESGLLRCWVHTNETFGTLFLLCRRSVSVYPSCLLEPTSRYKSPASDHDLDVARVVVGWR